MNTLYTKVLTILVAVAATVFCSCGGSGERLRRRADELCRYIPDHELQEKAKDYMTPDFYAVLDTMFHHLPEHEAMDHEWLYYFVTGNGGTIADYEVRSVEQTDDTHAVAVIIVRQKWEDGSFDPETDIEEHTLSMEKVQGEWLMSDFDGHKADCIRHIAISRREQAIRDAMSAYLIREIAPHYLQGDICIPTLLIVAEDEPDTAHADVLCDCLVYWYNLTGDTLKTVSGGNHSGQMTLCLNDGAWQVTTFLQTEDGAGFDESAKRIFGNRYDIYQNMHSNTDVREAVRQEQLGEYVRRHNLPVSRYQDFGWDAVEL